MAGFSGALESQLDENDSRDLDGGVALQLYITGKFEITTELLYLKHDVSQTSNFNAQWRDSTFRPLIRLGSPLLELLLGTREFGCWKGRPRTRGSRYRRSLNCKNSGIHTSMQWSDAPRF